MLPVIGELRPWADPEIVQAVQLDPAVGAPPGPEAPRPRASVLPVADQVRRCDRLARLVEAVLGAGTPTVTVAMRTPVMITGSASGTSIETNRSGNST